MQFLQTTLVSANGKKKFPCFLFLRMFLMFREAGPCKTKSSAHILFALREGTWALAEGMELVLFSFQKNWHKSLICLSLR